MGRQGKHLRWLIAITSLIVATTTWFSYKVVRNLLLDNLTKNAFLDVQQSANELDQWLLARKTEMKTLANTPTLRTMDWGQVGPFLTAEVKQMVDFYFVSIIYPDGAYYNTKVGQAVGKNLSDRQHFQEALAGKTYASDPVLSRTLDIPMVVITTPIWSDSSHSGDPTGVLSGLINIDRVTDVVGQLAYGDNSYALALRSTGVPIVHPDKERMGTRNDQVPSLLDSSDPYEVAIAQAMVAGNQGIKRTNLNNQPAYVAYMPLKEADWSIALVIPKKNIESHLYMLDLLAILVAGLLLTLLLMLWHGHNVEKKQLKRSKELADMSNRAKSKFLANISHELRTPLNGILGYAQILLRDQTASPSQVNQFQVIQQCGNHLLTLINDVLDIAKIEANRLELTPEIFSLAPFLDSLAEIFRMRAIQKGLSFRYELDSGLPTKVLGDPKRLRQVLMNLLSNAIKFTPKGQIDFRVIAVEGGKSLDTSEVDISGASSSGSSSSDSNSSDPNHASTVQSTPDYVEQSGDTTLHRLRFEVQDTGLGIGSQHLETIFRPFEQVGHQDKRQDGAGLGLAISRQILTLMESALQVDSAPGKGSQFSFEIELNGFETQRYDNRSNVLNSPSIITGYEGPPYTILIVDDKWSNRSILVNLLQSIGFMTIEALDGEEGLEKALRQLPDLIITDLVMPKMDGFEFLRRLKQVPQLQDTVAIASSASVFETDQHQSIAAGASAFLPKPIQTSLLFELLETYLPLKWVYCHQPRSPELTLESTPQSVSLSQNTLLRLQDFAALGDVDAIFRETEVLKTEYPDASTFLQTLQQLSQNCQLDDIESLLVHYVSVKQ